MNASSDTSSASSSHPGPRRAGLGVAVAVAALGGLLFGYDTGIVSSAQLYWGRDLSPTGAVSDLVTQVIVASLLLGALAGAAVSGWIADRLGRRATLAVVAVVFTLGAVASAAALTPAMLIGARLVLGVAIGMSATVVPLYIAEIAPREKRGALVSMNQLLITVGILVSYVVGKLLGGELGQWRLMLGLAAVPSALMLVGLWWVDESPRWLASVGRTRRARDILLRRFDPEDAERELYDITEESKAERSRGWREVFAPEVRPALVLGIGVAAFNQLVGVNAVLYYAPKLLVPVLGSESLAQDATIVIGAVNVLVTLLALRLIDRVGRRPLLLGGVALVTLSLVVMAVTYATLGSRPGLAGVIIVAALALYIGAFAASLGVAIWLINSEAYPNAVRGRAASLGNLTHWLLDASIALNVLTLFSLATPAGLFAIFAVFGVVGLVFLARRLPETKGRSLEEVNRLVRERAGR